MKTIKMNQTRMYQLVRDFGGIEVPDIEKTEFRKSSGSRSWWMEFRSLNQDGYYSCYISELEKSKRYFLQITEELDGERTTIEIPYEEMIKPQLVKAT